MGRRLTVHDIRGFDSDGLRKIDKCEYEVREGIIRYGFESKQFYIERAKRLYTYEAVDRLILLSEERNKPNIEKLAEEILEESLSQWRRYPNDCLLRDFEDTYQGNNEIIASERKGREKSVKIVQINLVSSIYSVAEYYLSRINENPDQLSKFLVLVLAALYPREWEDKLPENVPDYDPKDILNLFIRLTDDRVLITYFKFIRGFITRKDSGIEEMLTILEDLKTATSYRTGLTDLHLILSIIHSSMLPKSLSEISSLRNEIDSYFLRIQKPERYIDVLFRQYLDLFDLLQKFSETSDLQDKLYLLEESRRKIRESEILVENKFVEPFKRFYSKILEKWMDITFEEGRRLVGQISLETNLQTRRAIWKEELSISLNVKNVGLATAENVRVVLHGSSSYAISGQENHVVAVLPRNRSENVEFRIKPGKENSITFSFSIIPENDRNEEVTHTLFFVKQEEFAPIPNPYNFTRPAEDEMFFNREDLFQWVKNNMEKPTIYQNILIMGQRRTGKTSFLKELGKRIRSDHYCVLIDLEMFPTMGDAELLALICQELHRTIPEAKLPPRPQEFAVKSYLAFSDYVRSLPCDSSDSKKVIFIFDEFDKIESKIRDGLSNPGFLLFLRAFLQQNPRVTAVIGGKFDFNKLFSEEWREFFTIFAPRIIGVLDEKSAEALVTDPVKGLLQYDSFAVKKILDLSGRNPFYIQLLCHALIIYLNEKEKNFAEGEDVDATVLERAMEMAEPTLRLTWEEFNSSEKDVLFALSRLKVRYMRSVELRELEISLKERGMKMKTWELINLLGNLREKGIVTRSGGPSAFYDFSILLLEDWITENGSFTGE
ncbi:MAG: hypothetical protein HXS52_09355 [Theionarchaea archaeon]|nr:hypothetical protein [Theionarchaea archaeon]